MLDDDDGRALRRATRIVPLIAATALFIENLNSTVLSTALVTVAADFEVDPVVLKLALTSYLVSLAVFVPASGWIADRFGTRTVFCWAMAVFALGSASCALSTGLGTLVTARVIQGAGGAMMIPVARLVVLRSVPKAELVGALAILSMPSLVGPIIGPPVGGFFATYFTWHWIFWINLPLAASGILLARKLLPQIRQDTESVFDLRGFLMIGPALAMTITGATLLGLDRIPATAALALCGAGLVLVAIYCRHALSIQAPVIDLRLLRTPTFRIGVLGGFLFRVGAGATPFLLPLLLQVAFGMTAFASGTLTFATGVGAFTMKLVAPKILRAAGFRNVLMFNGIIAAAFISAPALFWLGMPSVTILGILLIGGFSRSLQFTSSNVVLYADIAPTDMGRATTFMAVLQELSGSIGIAFAALILDFATGLSPTGRLGATEFGYAFWLVGIIAGTSSLAFSMMPKGAGEALVQRSKPDVSSPLKSRTT
ncbi:MAG: MFS transporter [Alphaproteobacteria bacterium]|nr:MFS transporter [Alphaproteobacteria bacterium]